MPSLSRLLPRWIFPSTSTTGAAAAGACGNRPDFIVIGAQKAGTSSLFHYLSQHPQLCPASRKEVHFFDGGPAVDRYTSMGESWYRSQFPPADDSHPGCLAFEATPNYLFHPLVPRRIAEMLPHVKLIALLRSPTERAISHYFHSRLRGNEMLPILEALRHEEERLAPILERADYSNPAFRYHSYKSRGLYKQQLERYFEFFPRQQLLIFRSEEFFADTARALKRIYEFIGVDANFVSGDLRPQRVAPNKTDIEPAARQYLDEFFADHNRDLYDFIGTDFGW